MPIYAIAHLQDVRFGPDLAGYIRAVDDTFTPYGGRFLVHGASAEVLEGPFAGDIVIIEFPDRAQARAWYDSPAYQAILALRMDNSRCWVVLVDGVGAGHRAADILRTRPD